MLIAHAGLNPMGNKCKAGCPVRNIQATLDSLTSVGLSVAGSLRNLLMSYCKIRSNNAIFFPFCAVYEEIADIDYGRSRAGTTVAKSKERELYQVVYVLLISLHRMKSFMRGYVRT